MVEQERTEATEIGPEHAVQADPVGLTICADAPLAAAIVVRHSNIMRDKAIRLIIALACLGVLSACLHTDKSDLAALSGSELSPAEMASFQQKLSRLTFPVPAGTVQRLLPREVPLAYRLDADGFGLNGYLGSTVLYFRLTDEYGLRVEDKRLRRYQTQAVVCEERAEILTNDEVGRAIQRMSNSAPKAAP